MKDEHNVFDIPIGGFTGKTNLEEFENPFHDVGPINNMTKGSLQVRLICALDLNNDEIKVKTINFHGKIHVVDYFKWETNLNNYFEWKPMIKKTNNTICWSWNEGFYTSMAEKSLKQCTL